MARQRNRTAAVLEDGAIRDEWFTVETPEGNAVAGVDNVFDFEDEDAATLRAVGLAVELARPLTVVGYTRTTLGTYAAITKVERVEE